MPDWGEQYFDDGEGFYLTVVEVEDRGKLYWELEDKRFLIGSANSGFYQSEKQEALERAYEWFKKQAAKHHKEMNDA